MDTQGRWSVRSTIAEWPTAGETGELRNANTRTSGFSLKENSVSKKDQSHKQEKVPTDLFNESGTKYLRKIPLTESGLVDVYAVLLDFEVVCPARQHAIKKLLCSGIRGKASPMQDLLEARDAIDRTIQLQEQVER